MTLLYVLCMFLILALHVENILGIRCYTCTSISNSKCADPFELTLSDTNFIGTNCTSCEKVRSTRKQGRNTYENAVARGCLQVRKGTACFDGEYLDKGSTDCFCSSDLCNTGSTFVVSHVWRSVLHVVTTVLFSIL